MKFTLAIITLTLYFALGQAQTANEKIVNFTYKLPAGKDGASFTQDLRCKMRTGSPGVLLYVDEGRELGKGFYPNTFVYNGRQYSQSQFARKVNIWPDVEWEATITIDGKTHTTSWSSDLVHHKLIFNGFTDKELSDKLYFGKINVKYRIKNVVFDMSHVKTSVEGFNRSLSYGREAMKKADANIQNGNYSKAKGNANVAVVHFKNAAVYMTIDNIAALIQQAEDLRSEAATLAENKSKNATTEEKIANNNSTDNQNQQAAVAKVSTDTNANSVNSASSVDYTNKGNEYFSKDPDVAEMYYKKALEADPNNENAKTNLEKVQHNKRLIAQSKQLGIETSEMSHNMEQLSGHVSDAITTGNSHAIGMTGVKTAEVLAQSGASATEAMLGGAGAAVGAAVLNSWMNPKVQYDVVKEFEGHTFKGKMSNGKTKEGIVIYENGDVCKGSFFPFKTKAAIYKGTCVYHNGSQFDGRFVQGKGNKAPASGTMTFADGSVYKGTYKEDGFSTYDKRWKYGTYTAPDKKFVISGYFDENRKLSSGKFSYIYSSGNIITFSYPETETVSIKYANGDYLVIKKDDKSELKIEVTYRKKAVGYGGKKADLNIPNIDEVIKNVTELGGENNLAYILFYVSRRWIPEVRKEEYYLKAMELAISDEQRQFIEDETNIKVSIGGLFNKWTRYSQSLRWNFYKLEECKKDAWFNYHSAIQCFEEDRKAEAEEFIDKAIDNSEDNNTRSSIYYSTAKYFHIKLDYNKAMRYYRRSIRENYKHVSSIGNIGIIYYSMQDLDKSIEYLNRACTFNPKTSFGYDLALANFCAGNIKEAKVLYAKYRKILKKESVEIAINKLNKIKNNGHDDDAINDIIENILN
ncbi:hypothetical protein [Carboxylicivirga sp. M1479]|uniref:hypothetical protein n=1 Tax=Carboxylicivirga sp. M1479 TaxID=2594476 RepID=UPI0011782911|nr:hypothetical protein [Carboxylicivirga sp. M1479]TRX71018.1 hypothetical protein FNN09_08380 [Carboxylicivirga sp. M1479]